MVLRVAAARDPGTLAVWRLIWAAIASVIVAVATHPAANAALLRYDWNAQINRVRVAQYLCTEKVW